MSYPKEYGGRMEGNFKVHQVAYYWSLLILTIERNLVTKIKNIKQVYIVNLRLNLLEQFEIFGVIF